MKVSRQGKWAKRWWDDEIAAQCKAVRKAGRDGVGPGERENEGERRRVQRWKTEKARLILKRKKECWQRYAEEQSWDDVWKLVKYPWRTKETMKALTDDNGAACETDKLRALVDRNLIRSRWRWTRRWTVEEVGIQHERAKGEGAGCTEGDKQ